MSEGKKREMQAKMGNKAEKTEVRKAVRERKGKGRETKEVRQRGDEGG